MKEVEFRDIVQKLKSVIESFIKKPVKGMDFPSLKDEDLDLGQSAAWKRVKDFEYDYLEDDWEHCSTCIEGIVNSAKFVLDFMNDYLAGKYTEPRRVKSVVYLKKDRSESYTVLLELVDEKPKIVSVPNEISEQLQEYFNAKHLTFKNIEELEVPTILGEYNTDISATTYGVLFKEELVKLAN